MKNVKKDQAKIINVYILATAYDINYEYVLVLVRLVQTTYLYTYILKSKCTNCFSIYIPHLPAVRLRSD